jgi:hypothetical protein
MGDHQRLDPEIAAHYTSVSEQQRLGPLSLERVRTWELLGRHLPPPPAVVLDIGGAAGVYALPLAANGYQVHLVDPLALHVQQACAPRPSSRAPRWPAPPSVTPGSWTGRTPASTPPCCWAPCTTSPTGLTGSAR